MDIEARLADLERRQRNRPWWTLAGFAASLTLGAMLGAAGGSVPKEVRARAFVLEGPDGKVAAEWWTTGADEDGQATTLMNFFDGRQRPRITLGCSRDGYAHMGVQGSGERDALLMVNQAGVPRLIVNDESGHPVFSRP